MTIHRPSQYVVKRSLLSREPSRLTFGDNMSRAKTQKSRLTSQSDYLVMILYRQKNDSFSVLSVQGVHKNNNPVLTLGVITKFLMIIHYIRIDFVSWSHTPLLVNILNVHKYVVHLRSWLIVDQLVVFDDAINDFIILFQPTPLEIPFISSNATNNVRFTSQSWFEMIF